MKNSFIFALTLVGTVIGAGFATGQELFSFFVLKSSYGYFFYTLSSILLISTSYIVYTYASENRVYSQYNLYNNLFGGKISFLFNIISALFLFSCFVITASGTGTLFYENIKWPYFTGILTITVTTYAVMQFDIEGVYFINAILTPVIIFCILFLCILSAFEGISVFKNLTVGKIVNPILFAFLYFGYNIFSIIPIVLKSTKKNNLREIKKGFIISFFIILIMGSTILYALYGNIFFAENFNLPLLKIIGEKSDIYGKIYVIIMYFAMITTAVSCFYGFCNNIKDFFCINNQIITIFGLILAYFLSFIGFCDLVRNVYSFFGLFGIITSLSLIFKISKKL